jgi:enoyl-CoA hydratase/carnithine racemase
MSHAARAALEDAGGLMSVEQDGPIATVRFTRPDKHNAISFEMWRALSRVMPALAADDAVDVVVFSGTPGGPFSSGADISEFTTLRAGSEGAARYGAAVEAGERAVIAFPKPTIAAIEGFAIGAGTQLAVACDIRVCGETSRFGVTPARLGIVYALPSTARLVEVVGPAWARWILLTGELIGSDVAERIGLVHESVPDDRVLARARDIADILCSRAQVSLLGGKRLVDRVVAGRLDEDDEVRGIYEESWASPEYAEGVAAFVEKRSADFRTARRASSAQTGTPTRHDPEEQA